VSHELGGCEPMEESIVCYLNQLGRGTLDPYTEFVSEVPVLIALWSLGAAACIVLDGRRGKRVVAAVVLALGLHFLVSEAILKHLVLNVFPMRVRPYLAHPTEIVCVGTHFHDSSFPSSHAASTAAALTAFGHGYRRIVPAAIVFILVMAFARMHDGMHYPSDVLAGTMLGIGYAYLAVVTVKKYGTRLGLGAALQHDRREA